MNIINSGVADGSITTAKIADGAVTEAKLSLSPTTITLPYDVAVPVSTETLILNSGTLPSGIFLVTARLQVQGASGYGYSLRLGYGPPTYATCQGELTAVNNTVNISVIISTGSSGCAVYITALNNAFTVKYNVTGKNEDTQISYVRLGV